MRQRNDKVNTMRTIWVSQFLGKLFCSLYKVVVFEFRRESVINIVLKCDLTNSKRSTGAVSLRWDSCNPFPG